MYCHPLFKSYIEMMWAPYFAVLDHTVKVMIDTTFGRR